MLVYIPLATSSDHYADVSAGRSMTAQNQVWIKVTGWSSNIGKAYPESAQSSVELGLV